MFEQLSDHARKTMSLSRQTAERFHHDYIGTEHILLGMLQVDDSTAVRVLKNLGVDLEELSAALKNEMKFGIRCSGELPFTPRAKKTLEYAIDEAASGSHNHVGTEHLLLGLIREGHGLAARILADFGLDEKRVRPQVLETIASGKPGAQPSDRRPLLDLATIFDGCTNRFRFVLNLAQLEARRLDQDYVGSEHLLLGLIREGSGVAIHVLQRLGIDLESVKDSINYLSKPSPGALDKSKLPYSKRAEKVFEHAFGEMRLLKHPHMGTEHLLLGLLHEHGGVAAVVLTDLGLSLQRVRETIVDFLRDKPEAVKRFYIDTSSKHVDLYVKTIIKAAASEADAQGFDVVLPEHLLLGLLSVPDTLAAKLLKKHGLELDAVRSELRKLREKGTN